MQQRCGIGGHHVAMACSTPMSKRKAENDDSPRSCRPRAAGELVGDVGGQSFRRFGFVQSSIVSRWGEIVGERYAKVSSPESIRFPAGKKAGGVLTLAGRWRARAADPAFDADDRRAGQSLLRLCGDQPDRVQAGQAARAGRRSPSARSCARCRRNLAKGLREIADPELRACLELLAAQIAASSGPPSLPEDDDDPIPAINRSH